MVSELERQNVLADKLLSTLEKIKVAWDNLPSEDEVNDLAKAAGNMAGCLATAREQWDNLQSEAEVNDLAKVAGNVAASLRDTE